MDHKVNENVDIINIYVYNIFGEGIQMRIDEQIKILAIKSNMTLAEIGERMDKSPQAFSQKMKRGNYTLDELEEIARATGCRLQCSFELLNGERIILK